MGTELEMKTDPPREPRHWENLPAGTLAFSPVSIHIPTFARLCAKIAHGLAIAEFGIDGFAPLLPDFILNERSDIGFLVGGSRLPWEATPIRYRLNWHVYEAEFGALLGVDVHLFPGMGQPPVAVVVGMLNRHQHAVAAEKGQTAR